MRKILFVLIPSFVLSIIIFLLAQNLFIRIFSKGALQVTTVPASKVYLDGKYVGKTPLCKCEGKDMLRVGTYTLRLEPDDKAYAPYEEQITITRSILTVVDRKFGKGALSEGSTITLSPLPDHHSTGLVIVTLPSQANIFVDNKKIGESPVALQSVQTGDHTIMIKKDGYIEKIVRIRSPQGYKLSATVYLAASEVAQTSPTPTPSPSQAVAKVTILDTPTGFLRVRADATLSADEITQVHPGESYELLDERNGWYEIKLPNGKTGWINGAYAQKQ